MTIVLFASIPNPEKSVDGLTIYTRQVISLLESLDGIEVTTWHPVNPRLERKRSRIRSAKAWLTLTSELPGVHRHDLVDELVERWKETSSDLIIANHILTAWLIPHLPTNIPTVYLAHNAEHISAKTSAAMEHGLVRVTKTLEAVGRRKLERQILASTNGLIVLSHSDAERLGRLSPLVVHLPQAVVPPAFQAGTVPRPTPSNDILLLGSFVWTVKQANARWLATKVFPSVRQRVKNANLVIAGYKADLLTDLAKVEGVHLQPDPDEVDTLWRTASVCAVPEHQLGGVKLKVIDAAARGVPIVSTTGGVEGTHLVPGRSVLVANDPGGFADHIVDLLTSPDRAAEISANAIKDMSTYPTEVEKQWRLRETLTAIV